MPCSPPLAVSPSRSDSLLRRLARLGFAVVLLLAGAIAPALQAAESDDAKPGDPPVPKDLPELRSALAKILADSKTPGMALAIVDRDHVLTAEGIGLADVATRTPATADTMFRIGSTSKAFVALAALKLQREGKLDLTATLASLAPEVEFHNPWEATDPVRIVHLLEHTAGFDDVHLRDYAHEDPAPNKLKAALDYDPDSRTSRWRPGTRMAYCNSGPAVVAYVLQKITGEPIEDYIARELFRPIGMPRTSYFLTDEVKTTQATLYHPDGTTPYAYWNIALRPAGSINSSAREMAEYVRFYLNRGRVGPADAPTQLIAADDIARMEQPATNLAAAEGMTLGYGLHNYTSFDDAGFLWHGHNGGVLGGASDMSYSVEHGIGYSIIVNNVTEGGFRKITRLLRAYLTRDLPKHTLPVDDTRISDDLAQAYDGYYVQVSPRVQMLAGVERMVGIARLSIRDGKARFGPVLGGEQQDLVAQPDNPRLLRQPKRPLAEAVLLKSTDLGGPGLVVDTDSFVRVSALRAFAPLAFAALSLLTIVLCLLFVPIWGVRALLGKIRLREHLGLRLWPLLSSVTMAAGIASVPILFADENLFVRYGHLGLASLAIAATGVIAVLVAWIGLVRVLHPRYRDAHRGLRWLAWITLASHAGLAVYLVWSGTLPLVTWT